MTKYREILRLKSLGFSERNIAASCGVSRNTVAKVTKRAEELQLKWPLDFDMTDSVLDNLMFPKDKSATKKRMPDYDYIRKELLRNGVNKKLLWVEYCEECRMSCEEPLMYSQFCYYIQKDEEKRRATMHIPRNPGEQIEVDWAGDPAHIIDPDTGEITEAWLFVGVLTYSQYAFVEAFMNERTNNWIKAHNHMYQFFGGVTPMLVSDNCTTAINHQKSDWYTPALNTTYHEMAEHYNVAIIPARVRKPKDKPNVEGSVGKISTWITAALRNEQFFSLAELNAAIREKLDAYNARKFQKKECSRLSLFLGEEMPLLAPLPATPFELCEWKQATIVAPLVRTGGSRHTGLAAPPHHNNLCSFLVILLGLIFITFATAALSSPVRINQRLISPSVITPSSFCCSFTTNKIPLALRSIFCIASTTVLSGDIKNNVSCSAFIKTSLFFLIFHDKYIFHIYRSVFIKYLPINHKVEASYLSFWWLYCFIRTSATKKSSS